MFKVTKYPHGTLSWADCSSTDVAKAKPFYAGLMGWQMEDMPMGEGLFYTMYKQDGARVAAISPLPPDMQGMPSMWNSYITVDDVDSLASKVSDLGGKVLAGPFDVFDAGRMATIQDPTGAAVSLWQAKNHIGAELVNTPGALTWNELYTKDSASARDFYGKLLGWDYQKMEGADYYVITNRGRMNGGIMQMTDEFGDTPPNWTVYFSVANIDESVKKAEALGGKLLSPVTDAGGIGRFAMIADPAGASCALIQLEQPQPWAE